MKTIVIKNLSTVDDHVVMRLIENIERGLKNGVGEVAEKLNIEIRIKESDVDNKSIYTVIDREDT